jgi:integrase
MAKIRPFKVMVGDGTSAKEVRYSAKKRPDSEFLQVEFNGADGKVIRKGTTGTMRGGTPDGQFDLDATRHIVKAYQHLYTKQQAKKNWAAALDEAIETCGARQATIDGYRVAVKAFREFMPDSEYPADVTDADAQRFGRLFLNTPYTRGKSKILRKRKPVTLSMYKRTLSGLWSQHFKPLGIVGKNNPFAEIVVPEGDKPTKYVPTEAHISRFFDYIRQRYPDWTRLHALLALKLCSACRTNDIVQLRSDQIRTTEEDGPHLYFAPEQVKTGQERMVPLSPELYAEAKSVAGPVWLWDGWNEDLKKFRPGRNKLPDHFKPRTVAVVINNIFREYSDANPDVPRISPHDFRRRTITLMVTRTENVPLTAQALGLNEKTANKHYIDHKQAHDVKKAFRLTGDLMPKPLNTDEPKQGT